MHDTAFQSAKSFFDTYATTFHPQYTDIAMPIVVTYVDGRPRSGRGHP